MAARLCTTRRLNSRRRRRRAGRCTAARRSSSAAAASTAAPSTSAASARSSWRRPSTRVGDGGVRLAAVGGRRVDGRPPPRRAQRSGLHRAAPLLVPRAPSDPRPHPARRAHPRQHDGHHPRRPPRRAQRRRCAHLVHRGRARRRRGRRLVRRRHRRRRPLARRRVPLRRGARHRRRRRLRRIRRVRSRGRRRRPRREERGVRAVGGRRSRHWRRRGPRARRQRRPRPRGRRNRAGARPLCVPTQPWAGEQTSDAHSVDVRLADEHYKYRRHWTTVPATVVEVAHTVAGAVALRCVSPAAAAAATRLHVSFNGHDFRRVARPTGPSTRRRRRAPSRRRRGPPRAARASS